MREAFEFYGRVHFRFFEDYRSALPRNERRRRRRFFTCKRETMRIKQNAFDRHNECAPEVSIAFKRLEMNSIEITVGKHAQRTREAFVQVGVYCTMA